MKLLQSITLSSVFLAFLATSNNVYADPSYKIFVDLDNSPNEIDAATAGAKPETVIVIPHRTEGQEAKLRELYKIETALANGKSSDVKTDSARKSVLKADLKRSFGSLPLSSETVSTELSEAIAQYQPVTSLILSGHYADSAFTGVLGSITPFGLSSALIENADEAKTIRSFYGMGCYTATAASVRQFRGFVPNLVEVGGYDPKGYLNSDPQDAPYLKSSLSIERDLLKAFDEKKTQAELDGIINSAILKYKNAAICVCHICTSNVYGDVDIDEVLKGCGIDALGSISSRMQGFWEMSDPKSTENRIYCDTSSSPLRDLYTDVKNHEQCTEDNVPLSPSYVPFMKTAPGLIRMVHFQNVLSNFVRYNAKDLDELKSLSKTLNFPMMNLKVPMACVGEHSPKTETDRGTLIRWIASLPEDPEVGRIKQRMVNQLTDLDCVPVDWIKTPDPNSQLSSPLPVV